ncbi:MAG: hypothetical protein ACE5IK_08300 [Acidobacteriota bacterium]
MPDQTPDSPRGPGEPLPDGPVTFDLPLGPLRLRIVDLPTAWHPFVEENYAPFAEPPTASAPDLVVHCTPGAGIVIPLPGPGGTPVMQVDALDGVGCHRIRSHWQDGEVDLERGEARLTLTSCEAIPLRMSLENFLRVAGQLMLPRRDAFLLHSAGILDAGRCFLFFGHSGAGKSTVTSLSAPRSVLSDDMVLVDVSGETTRVHAVPFFGAFPPEQRTRGAYPAAAALRLRQADENRVETLSRARAVATVTSSVPFVHDLGLTNDHLTDLLVRFCHQVPVADLHFTRSTRFWEPLHQNFGDA